MATYPKLLLSTGGGIISKSQQADQAVNTATVLIGLGGTGVDCLKSIRKAVGERLKPDDPYASIPTYEHIQFIAVDTDKRVFDSGEDDTYDILQPTDYFNISNPKVKEALKAEAAIAMRKELDWMDASKLDVLKMGDAGAGGLRQAGRYMLMDRSNDFMDKVTLAINNAKKGLASPRVNIHIFSGIGGGTGSGTFLDACYLVRQVLTEQGGGNFLGYFFLPDVNLDINRIPKSNRLVHEYIPRNGYAAMQELDYCMRLGDNGGEFTQIYKGGKSIPWKESPVDMCHLISATDAARNVKEHPYEYAMNVTTEYVMNFLTKPAKDDFALMSHLANFEAQVAAGNGKRELGADLRYCILGGACASIPMREINTYLASRLFGAFSSMCGRVPSQRDVEGIAHDARLCDNPGDGSRLLFNELCANGGDASYLPAIDWKQAKAFGASDQNLVRHYEEQYSAKCGVLEKNAQSMMDEDNQESLIRRIRRILDCCAGDLNLGTTFAYGVVSAARDHNMLNLVAGLTEANKKAWEHEQFQIDDHAFKDYEYDRDVFRRKPNKNNYNRYVESLEILKEHQVRVVAFSQVDKVLRKLRQQLEEAASTYYLVLDRVMRNLITTFHENYQVLVSEKGLTSDDGFTMPLVKLSEIQGKLDEEIQKLNLAGVLSQFVGVMINNEDEWRREDENNIARLVNEFFVTQVFGGTNGFANKTITGFLEDKYQTTHIETITNKVYKEYMGPLSESAAALFPFDHSVWQESRCGVLSTISVPETAQALKDAAQQLFQVKNEYKVNASALTDRIYLMRCSCALPIGSYGYCEEYGREYFDFGLSEAGRHYYEGKGASKWFSDWRDMTSLTPNSHNEGKLLPDKLRDITEGAEVLYRQAVENGFLQESRIMCLSEDSAGMIQQSLGEVMQLEARAEQDVGKAAVYYNQAIGILRKTLDTVTTVETGYALPTGSNVAEDRERVRKDFFFISPALQNMVKVDLGRINEIHNKIADLTEKVEKAGASDKEFKDFCQALFSGIIQYKGMKVEYVTEEFGMEKSEELSNFDTTRYQYCQLPLYQAYLTFKVMDQNTRAEMAQKSTEEIQNYTKHLKDTVAHYREVLTPEFNKKFQTVARTYPMIQEDANAFIFKLNAEFQSFAAMF